ncbi:MAG: RecX family transcriptional regulator [Eubacteriales bacterium]|nr:RecX family transcriptional regulator [Eubacteriales bacterium]
MAGQAITVQAVKQREGTNRFRITLCFEGNGTEERSLDILGAFLPFEVCSGAVLNAEMAAELLHADEVSRAVMKGADLLDLADHSQKQLVDKLRRRGFSAKTAGEAVQYLAKRGMLREEAYMVRCMEYLCNKRRLGPMRIGMELAAKGIRPTAYRQLYEQTMGRLDFDAALEARLSTLRPDAFATPDAKRKTIAALQRYGFPLSMIRHAAESKAERND